MSLCSMLTLLELFCYHFIIYWMNCVLNMCLMQASSFVGRIFRGGSRLTAVHTCRLLM